MHTFGVYGRVLSRTLANSLYGSRVNQRGNSSAANEAAGIQTSGLVSAVAGFPKDFKRGKVRKGQIGDDAWLIAKTKSADVLGVADGVGGWRDYGVDPGDFSHTLLKSVERVLNSNQPVSPRNPAALLASAFRELLHSKRLVTGSSTACLVVLDRDSNKVFTVNIGDSGFLIVRKGRIVHQSEEQQHYFNTPFQLAVPPPGHNGSVLSDSPESADRTQFAVEDGDVILLATDGVFDNVPTSVLLAELDKLGGSKDEISIQQTANSIALMARSLAFDERYLSPFAKRARDYGIRTIGGKPDDITVLLACVTL